MRLIGVLALAALGTAPATDPVYHLSIGDPARKSHDASVTLDAITDTATGESIAPRELGARLASARLVLVGEREPDSFWPTFGLSTRAAEDGRRAIIDVEKDTPAASATLQVADVIVSIDGNPIDGLETLNRQLAGYRWGDVPVFAISRSGAALAIPVPLGRRHT